MKHTIVLFLLLCLLLTLTACTNLPANPEKMSPEQLREWAKDKNVNVACGVGNGPGWRGSATYVVLDKGIVINGTVTVDPDCKVTISNQPAK